MYIVTMDIDDNLALLENLKELVEPVATVKTDRIFYALHGYLKSIKVQEEIRKAKQNEQLKKARGNR